ncbi:peptide deformylase [Rubellimicrobium aerolatum]|uniref:Peptide deformylase n=1 Tax=Rubellimicrobium aerolatum TaxID=490979 RepID=A0ABW0SD03_9RHOB|nr:peptide deformylase [Rubellimicrobium aerolatum]
MIRSIRQVPDTVLREVCTSVATFDGALRELAEDMLATMYDAPGRGLAAPQVGVALRIFVMDVAWRDGAPAPQVFVNPEIVAASAETVTREEGCLSIPGRTSFVARSAEVALRWRGIDGTAREGSFDGFAATCVQHEIDHLDGILCTDWENVPT